MNKKYQNGFFIFGIVLLAVMVTQLDFDEVWRGLRHAGYWFFAVVALWGVLYMLNTAAWYIIIKSQVPPIPQQTITTHHPSLTTSPLLLLVALQDNHLGICTQLCYSRRTDGW